MVEPDKQEEPRATKDFSFLLTTTLTISDKEIEKHNREVHKKNIHHKLMQAHGVQILDLGSSNETDYNDFYMQVFEDVGKKIAESKVSIK